MNVHVARLLPSLLLILVAGCGEDPPVPPPAEAAPVITSFAGPERVPRGERAELRVSFKDPDGDLATAELSVKSGLGLQSKAASAALLHLEGVEGSVSLPLPTGALPFGPVELSLTLIDAAGHRSSASPLNFTVVGRVDGGAPPTLVRFDAVDAKLDRPTGPFDRTSALFTMAAGDDQGQLASALLKVTTPAGEVKVVELEVGSLGWGPAGGVSVHPVVTFDSEAPLGVHTLELTVYDLGGNASAPLSTTVELVGSGGRAAPTLTSFFPVEGTRGSTITVAGTGLAMDDSNLVLLNDLPMEVVNLAPGALQVRVPLGAASGALVLENAQGRAIAPELFIVPEQVVLSTTTYSLAVGGRVRIDARNSTPRSSTPVFAVNGVIGGDSVHGRITDQGVYTAPDEIPAAPIVIRATSSVDPTVYAEAQVTLIPRVGTARALLTTGGGRVYSLDRRAELSIPPGALAVTTTITIEVLSTPPAPVANTRAVGAVELGPDGATFLLPVELRVRLVRPYPPGARLPLYSATGASAWVREGEARVDADGEYAVAELRHFSRWTIVDQASLAGTRPLTLTALELPAVLEEGGSLPAHLVGTGISTDVEATVLDANHTPTEDVVLGPLHTLGDEAGLLLESRPLPNLGPGQQRTYYLRLFRPSGEQAELPFQIEGLDELVVPAGTRQTLTGQHRYSGLEVHGELTVPSDQLILEVTGPATITGVIDAAGAPGGDAHAEAAGTAPPGAGAGGVGRRDNGCFLFFSCGYDGAEVENFGQNGEACVGYPADPPAVQGPCAPLEGHGRRVPLGLGGRPGTNVDVVEDLIGFGIDASTCVAGSGPSCVAAVADVINVATGVAAVDQGAPTGWRGFGAARTPIRADGPELGGGGGGGGGRATGGVGVVALHFSGGGGGGGGGGARPISLWARGPVDLGASGRITTSGGDGGDGASEGTLRVGALFDIITVDISSSAPAFSGGGGGGGAASRVTVRSGTELNLASPDQVVSQGGRGGRGGTTIIDPINGGVDHAYQSSPASDGPWAIRTASGPDADQGVIGTRVTGRRVYDVRHRAYYRFRGEVIVTDRAGVRRYPVDGESTQTRITLEPGFNTVRMNSEPELFARHLLVLAPDADFDGLSDEDEAALGTSPTTADTDGDGVTDGLEIELSTNPLSSDADGDDLPDGEEVQLGTDPNTPDSDGDGVFDGLEVVLGHDPQDRNDTPRRIPTGWLLGASGPNLIALDPNSGRSARLGNCGGLLGFGFTFDGAGTMYTAELDHLEVSDVFTCATREDRGPFRDGSGTALRVGALAHDPITDRYYGVEYASATQATGQLVTVDPSDARVVRVGPPQATPITGLAVDAQGDLYAVLTDTGTAGSDRLVVLDGDTGAIDHPIGALGATPVLGLAAQPGGPLYFSAPGLAGTALYTLDPLSGQRAPAGNIPGRVIAALGFARTPPGLLTTHYPVGLGPSAVVAVDLDGDQALDLAISNGTSGTLSVLRGNGDGTFGAANHLPAGTRPGALAAGDLNGDGLADLALSDHDDDLVRTFLGVVGGLPSAGPASSVTAPYGLTVGAFDAAPSVDLVVIADGLRLMSGSGAGAFTSAPALPVSFSEHLRSGDLDGDGNLDVVLQSFGSGALSVLLGDGTTLVPQATPYPAPIDPRRPAFGDADGDGDVDVLVAVPFSGQFYLLLGNGDGTFQPATLFAGGGFPGASALGDLTGDGLADAILSDSGGLTVLAGDGAGNFNTTTPVRLQSGGDVRDLTLGDFDGDGLVDCAAVSAMANEVVVFLQVR